MTIARIPLLTVGVLGGMGPAATVDFFNKIIKATPAKRDQDHIPILIWNWPQIPDRSAAILSGDDSPLQVMLGGLAVLERAGADFLAIPCNTAHHWHERLHGQATAPILHIADTVADAVRKGADKPLGLLSTRGTIAGGIYQRRLAGVADIVLPDEQTQCLVDEAIGKVKAGQCGRKRLDTAIERMMERGAQSLVLACTELPIAIQGSRWADRCIDATQTLAEACVARSYGWDGVSGDAVGAPT